jgi:hypothetical protein
MRDDLIALESGRFEVPDAVRTAMCNDDFNVFTQTIPSPEDSNTYFKRWSVVNSVLGSVRRPAASVGHQTLVPRSRSRQPCACPAHSRCYRRLPLTGYCMTSVGTGRACGSLAITSQRFENTTTNILDCRVIVYAFETGKSNSRAVVLSVVVATNRSCIGEYVLGWPLKIDKYSAYDWNIRGF